MLTVSDHLKWSDAEHVFVLQEKLNAYIAFIESGQIESDYPGSVGRKRGICVMAKYEPSNDACEFFEKVRGALAEVGIDFEVKVVSPGGSGGGPAKRLSSR
jgi:hypothetical protein